MREQLYRGNQSFKDKVFALDFTLIFLVLILGIISIFAMYSTEQGQYGYYTKSHLYRFFIFFSLFIVISFLRINFWFKSGDVVSTELIDWSEKFTNEKRWTDNLSIILYTSDFAQWMINDSQN